ncbi:MAG TPA: SDR family NAD(P)-dependent oxidoreductase [Spirochaetales bacterium]|nr:SDR family NAD(P)-dependent oxidoreductase [Spirochaetales bacterium]HRZ63838.1 SDR family NAD(P)-dependent oxidoreductase [Spirochaetia bacterium]
MEHREDIVLVTGASEGIGNACATFVAKKGFRTYGTCPNPNSYERKADEFFELIAMDPREESSVAKAAEALLAREKRLDALVCCSGTGFFSSIEDCSLKEVENIFESNLFGAIRTIKAFLPAMREAGSGRILVVAPLAAGSRLPGMGLCSAAARAVEAIVDTLRVELKPYGIQASVLEVGPIRAIFHDFPRAADFAAAKSHYRRALRFVIDGSERLGPAGDVPLGAARAVHELISASRLPARRRIAPLVPRATAFFSRVLPLWLDEALLILRLRLHRHKERKS